MLRPTPIVINWHLTEDCNYRCRFCYAKWTKSNYPFELIHNQVDTVALLNELSRFFNPEESSNPFKTSQVSHSVRLNLAGGEPLLHTSKILHIVSQARGLGFEVSLISNGSMINNELLSQLAPQLAWLGISIDSCSLFTNQAIGRVDHCGRLLDLDYLATSLKRVRYENSCLRLKLNTVVNKLNHYEDLSPLIRSFAPDKWKVLRMLPVVNQRLTVNDQQFSSFLDRHSAFAHILHAEDNQDMLESYLMIDPYGRFFQNSPRLSGNGYVYSRPILSVGATTAFSEMAFDLNRYDSRYSSGVARVVA